MKDILKDIQTIDEIIKQLNRIDNKLVDGKIILAWRDVNSLKASFEKYKIDLISNNIQENKVDKQ